MPYASMLADSPSITAEYGWIAGSADPLWFIDNVEPWVSNLKYRLLSIFFAPYYLIDYEKIGETYPV